ncbi:ABC transporter substrate-binding protein [Methylophilaceae bacterium]|jgi:phospholipid transport system substrate-binding protein|uniref:Toluene tolerance n=1 Tax=Methylophilales bacterium HTCC2181 TaxID=383631 RepID=A0P4I4_9PROT|nr:Toluene tolerance [Methylophilales bacterium HTCC2181]MCH9841704.1 ABC transporter substrate-binding protein [Betaproteobacteria bacterium]MDA9085988.1 ABC transporter substrate-binding protein [Methylophilaceae bacterium]MDB9716850.1 ABC transporter substrate-binding protein [Methylophilaceae bacterium]MDC0115323.1 ABC transporter substrate-binding protein [Methylophilaceae bacterium]
MLKNIIFLCVLSFASANVFANIGPDELVRKTADDVISTIKQDKDIQAGDTSKIYKLAEEKILPNFDFERISRLVLGKAWRKATDKQKTEFKYEFKNLLLRTYAVALSKYKDQKIEYKPLRMKPTDEIVTVKTEIIQSGGQPIDVDYALAKQDDGWLVIDIIIEGVSLVTNYRSQFASEIKKNGMDSLIIELAKKNKTNDS